VRACGMVRCLSRFASVHLLAIGDPDAARRPEVREGLGASIEAFPAIGPGRRLGLAGRRPHGLWHYRSPGLATALGTRRVETPTDLAFFEEAVMAQYAGFVGCPAVLDRQKIEWAYHASVRRFLTPAERLSPQAWLRAVRSRLEASRFRRFEQELRGRFGAVFVLGEGDRRLLAPIHGEEVVHVVANGVDARIRMSASRTREVRFVLLYGSLDYPPNAEAQELYFRRVWPALRAASSLDTVVVGHGRPLRPLPTRDPRVQFRGFVPEVLPVLSGPGLLLVPLRVGGGIRNKILEALGAGMPVVSTGVGAENLGLVDGRHYLQAESPAQMIEAVLRLARDPALVASLARAGSRLVEESFRWERIGQQIESVCRGVAEG